MKLIISTILISLFLAIGFTATAQKMNQGSIAYEIEVDTDNPMAGMMADSKLEIIFTETQYRTNINMMMGMMQIQTITNTKDPKQNKLFMNMMGKKYEITDIEAEQQESMNQFFDISNIGNIVYDKKDTKTILGYPCYKATITKKDNSTVIYYISEKIKIAPLMDNTTGTTLAGFPLMLITEAEEMKMSFVAKKISKELPADAWTLPTGYEKITYTDFEKMSGALSED